MVFGDNVFSKVILKSYENLLFFNMLKKSKSQFVIIISNKFDHITAFLFRFLCLHTCVWKQFIPFWGIGITP